MFENLRFEAMSPRNPGFFSEKTFNLPPPAAGGAPGAPPPSPPYTISKSDAVLSLNGAQVGTSGFLRHNFYIDNLSPGLYQVLVTREGDNPWHRTLVVEPELVTDAQAFLIPF